MRQIASIICALVLLVTNTLVSSSRYNLMGSQDQAQAFRLKSQYDLQPGTVLKLPIDVTEEYLSLFGTLPPRLVSISARNSNGVYGIGDVIYIDLQFTIAVSVTGIPTLTLNTGCYDSTCATKEIQSFVCKADRGNFALQLENQFIMNIDANTTDIQFETRLEKLIGINNVTVTFDDILDRDYSEGNRICTSLGKNVTIVFENVTFPQYNGDVPIVKFSADNAYADLRSGLQIGSPSDSSQGGFLKGVNVGYTPTIKSVELARGFQKADGIAYYLSGSGTNTVTFAFTVNYGDFTPLLEVKSINFDQGYISSPITDANISTSVPNYKSGPRYMAISASSLGFNKNISITSAQPQINAVTSSFDNGVYTEGDNIVIQVVYNLPVKISQPGSLKLQLSTGTINRQIPFYKLTDNYFVIEFLYVVQQGDTSSRLDVLSSDSLTLNGGTIYRRTSTNETLANVTLPTPGSSNSLSVLKNFVINTFSSQVISVGAISKLVTYTSGDNIDFQVQYENPVQVTGSPRLLISNTPRLLQAGVRTAPFLPSFSYTRAFPLNDTQIQISLKLNWNLERNDTVVISLPNFSMKSPYVVSTHPLSISGQSSSLFLGGLWSKDIQSVFLTVANRIPLGTMIDLLIDGKSELFIPADGVQSESSGVKFQVLSSAVNYSFTSEYAFQRLGSVGFESTTVYITPKAHDQSVSITFDFAVPEALSIGDFIILHLNNFVTSVDVYSDSYVSEMPYFKIEWNKNSSEFTMTVVMDTQILSQSIEITKFVSFQIPQEGVGADSIKISASMSKNGYFDKSLISSVTNICGFREYSVGYSTKSPGVSSSVTFTWEAGPNDFKIGDQIVFTLPAYNTSIGTQSRQVFSSSLSGVSAVMFTVTVKGALVYFTSNLLIPAYQYIEITVDESVGLIVPSTGINPNVDFFMVQTISKLCSLDLPIKVFFTRSEAILYVTNPTLSLLSTGTLKLDGLVSIEISFGLSVSLFRYDTFVVTIPNFYRNVLISPQNSSISSNAKLKLNYNSKYDQLEFTLNETFIGGQILSVVVNYAQSFHIPTSGIAFGDFVLNIFSIPSGTLDNQIMAGPCLGLCSVKVGHSHQFYGSPVDVSYTILYSKSLYFSTIIEFDLQGFDFTSLQLPTVQLSILNQNVITIQQTISIASFSNSKHISITVPLQINSLQYFIVKFIGLYYSNKTVSSSIVKIVDSSLGGVAQYQCPSNIVLNSYYFGRADIFFRNVTGSVGIKIFFSLPSHISLAVGDSVEISLPGFSLSPTSKVDISSLANLDYISYDLSEVSLHISFNRSISSLDEISLEMYDLNVPMLGVPANSSSLSYYLNIAKNNVLYKTLKQTFNYVEELVVISNFNVHLSFFSGVARFNLSFIQIDLFVSTDLNIGDHFYVVIPSLLNYTLVNNSIPVTSLLLSHAQWLPETSAFLVTIDAYHSSGQISMIINAHQSSIGLSNSGLAAGSQTSVNFYKKKSDAIVAVSTSSLSCFGICDASMTPLVRKAGFVSEYSLQIIFGSVYFSVGDQISLNLVGFDTASQVPYVTSGKAKSVNGIIFTILVQIQWIRNISSLELIFLSCVNITNHSVQTFSFNIGLDFALKSPVTGIRQGQLFNIKWMSESYGENYTFSNDILQIQPIGIANYSSIKLLPEQPSAIVDVEISFKFLNDLNIGDFINIYLAGFVVPGGHLQIFNSSLDHNSISVVGNPQSTDSNINVDGSIYYTEHIASLTIAILTNIKAGTIIAFALQKKSGQHETGIRTPSIGVYKTTVPKFSVVSQSNPMAAALMSNYTTIGSLSPSHLTYSHSNLNSTIELIVKFQVNCPLLTNDSIYILMPNIISMNTSSVVNVTRVNSSHSSNFLGRWNYSHIVIDVSANTFILSGNLQLVIVLTGFSITNQIFYKNDKHYLLSVQSEMCPIQSMPFDHSDPRFVISSSVSIGNSSNSKTSVPINVKILPYVNLQENDTISLLFTGLLINNQLEKSRSISIRGSTCLYDSAFIRHVNSSLSLDISVLNECTKQEPIILNFSINMTGIIINPFIAAGSYTNVKMALNRTVNNKNQELYQGDFQTIEYIDNFSNLAINIANPYPSVVSQFSIIWSLGQTLSKDDIITVFLAGFTRTTIHSISEISSITIFGTAAPYFDVTWNPTASLLYLTALYHVPVFDKLEAIVVYSNGFIMPTNGIVSDSSLYVISLKKKDIYVANQVIESVSVVPVVLYSSLFFISSDWSASYDFGGDYHVIQLEAGHELSVLDSGAQIVMNGKFYTIDKVMENLLYLIEPYSGVRVFLGYPSVSLYTPPFRFAYYLSGSNTQSLLFRYKVRRGDFSSSLGIYNPSQSIYNSSHQSLELYGGNILRLSDNPLISVSTVIPSYSLDVSRNVDSSTPVIIALTTSSISGVYSMGQKVDFQIKYSHTVFVGNFSTPILLLKVEPFGRVNAYYNSGTGSDTIVFVYTVSQEDFQFDANNSLLTTRSPIFQPLRVITTNSFNFIRRFSSEPIINVDVNFSNKTLIQIPVDLSLIGDATKVIGISSTNSSRNDEYTAGDKLFVYVTFSNPVIVSNFENKSSMFISLDLNSIHGSNAKFYSMYNSTTLVFAYSITFNDVALSGLFLKCTCLDYFERTFIHLNGSNILSRQTNISASAMLTNSSSKSDLLITETFRIDNTVPRVTGLYSNISKDIPVDAFSPGDVILISVTFSHLVTVRGIIRLILKGESTKCPARFYYGNNTNTLQFLYVISHQSGVARLDCTDINSLDLSKGQIYRLSDQPSIIVNSNLPRPGVENSLGLQSSIVIDTTPIVVRRLDLYGKTALNIPYLPIPSVGFNIYGNQSGVFRYSSDSSLNIIEDTLSLNTSLSNTIREFEDEIVLSSSSWSQYERILVMDKYLEPFRFLSLWNYVFPFPQLGFQSYWWSAINIQSEIEIEASFNRGVIYKDISLQLNIGSILNKAFSVNRGHVYYLEVSLSPDEQSYRIEYGGKQTICISNRASSKGLNSIKSALESVNSIKVLLPNVEQISSSESLLKFQIYFNYLPLYEFRVLNFHTLGESCHAPISEGQVVIYKDKKTATFVYDILSTNSIILTSVRDLSPGNYTIQIGSANGIVIDKLGIEAHTVWVNKYKKSSQLISKSTIPNFIPVPTILKSSLSYDSNIPQSLSVVYINICFGVSLSRDDTIDVDLPGFVKSSNIKRINSSDPLYFLSWKQNSTTLTFRFLQETSSCFEAKVKGLVLPSDLIFENSFIYMFSVNSSSNGRLTNRVFDYVNPIGISRFMIDFSDYTPGISSEIINVSFTIIPQYVYNNQSKISIFLHGFHLSSFGNGILKTDSNIFKAVWDNVTEQVIISPIMFITEGIYSFSILSDNQIISLIKPSHGMIVSNPPTVEFSSNYWTSDKTLIVDYPFIYGYHPPAALFIDLIYNDTDTIKYIHFSVTMTSSIIGPTMLRISIPCLSNSLKYYVSSNANSSEYDNILWDEETNTFLISNKHGWPSGSINIKIVDNLETFYINELGIENEYGSHISFSLQGQNGIANDIPIIKVNRIPRIQYSSFKCDVISSNLFYNDPFNISISILLNMVPRFGDMFSIALNGLASTSERITISNPCLLLNMTNANLVSNDSINVFLSNLTNCQYEKKMEFFITVNSPNILRRSIVQFHSNNFFISYMNDEYYLENLKFTHSPAIGIVYSSLDVENPYGGESSHLTFKILTTSTILTGDKLILSLKGFWFNFTQVKISDNYENDWLLNFDSTGQRLVFESLVSYPSINIYFSLKTILAATIPSFGMTSNSNANTITISRNSVSLIAQNIGQVTPVGFISNLSFRPKIKFSSDKYSSFEISFNIQMTTNSILNAGDIIYIYLSHYMVKYDSLLLLSDTFSVRAESYENKLIINVLNNDAQNYSLNINTLPTQSIEQLSATDCSITAGQCTLHIAIQSRNCPIRRQPFGSNEIFFGNKSSIRFYTTNKVPTLQPSALPLNNTGLPQNFTSDPSISPSEVPTESPTAVSAYTKAIFVDAYFVVDISFNLGSEIKMGTKLLTHNPYVITKNNSIDLTVIIGNSYWSIGWHNNSDNEAIVLTASQNLQPGFYNILVGSNLLRLSKSIIYKNDPSIKYSLIYDDYLFVSGNYLQSSTFGLSSSSIKFNKGLNPYVSIEIKIVADNQFSPGDSLYVILPNFKMDNVSALTFNNLLSSDSQFQIFWNETSFTLNIQISVVISVLNVFIPISNKFVPPEDGCNEYKNTPSLDLINNDGRYFQPTKFQLFTSLAASLSINILFIDPMVGQNTVMNITFSSPSIIFDKYDSIELFFPQFWSTASNLTIDSSLGSFVGIWIPCDETLRLQSLSNMKDVSSFSILVNGINLPNEGVSSYLSSYVTFSTNSSVSGSLVSVQIDMKEVGYFYDSSLNFNPKRLGEDVSLNLSFYLSIELGENEYIQVSLPGLTVSNNLIALNAVSTFNTKYSLPIHISWDSNSEKLIIVALKTIPKDTYVSFLLNRTVILPTIGIPDINNENSINLSLYDVDGQMIGMSQFQNIDIVGLKSASVVYLFSDISSSISLKFQFQISDTIHPGDSIYISTPFLNAPYADLTELNYISNDQPEKVNSFLVSFDPSSGLFVLKSISSESSRLITVFIDEKNGFQFSKFLNSSNSAHFIYCNISSVGLITNQQISYAPTEISDFFPLNFEVDHCTLSGCSINFNFVLNTIMPSGERISIYHPSFKRMIQGSLMSISNDSFSASWRVADNARSLSIQTNNIVEEETGFIMASSNLVNFPINITLPSTSIDNDIIIISSIPKIDRTYTDYSYSNLICGDTLYLNIIFDKPVIILEPFNISLLLSTLEYAHYFSGNESNLITFVYHPINPITSNDLEILGPGALEYFPSNSVIASFDNPSVIANTTIPEPYGKLRLIEGVSSSLYVSPCSVTAEVILVESYSPKFTTYYTGDVVDVAVNFNRPVSVDGMPKLTLSNPSNSNYFLAAFTNVSNIQWLKTIEGGYFSFSYLGFNSSCIYWNDTNALYNEIEKMEAIQESFPLVIESLPLDAVFRFKLIFLGVAPSLFQQNKLACDLEVKADFSIDPSMLNKVIFRYNVEQGDLANLLTYPNISSILIPPNSAIKLAAQNKTVNLTLPELNSKSSLEATSRVRLHSLIPNIASVFSNFSKHANSGDLITITVNFTESVYVDVNSSIYLELQLYQLNSHLSQAKTKIYRNISLHSSVGSHLYFKYLVEVGDVARYLGTHRNMLYVDGMPIKLRSLVPTTLADISLPLSNSTTGLSSSGVVVNATAPPIILNVETSHVRDVTVNAGEEIYIVIHFSSIVDVIADNLSIPPYINLVVPFGSKMIYNSGSGTKNLIFLYIVQPGDIAHKNLSFTFNLQQGQLNDSIGNLFKSHSPSLIHLVNGISVDTRPAVVIKVDTVNIDDDYYPGDELDIFVQFNKAVIILSSELPFLQLFIPHQEGSDSVANYSHGNGSINLHFKYVIPSPNVYIPEQIKTKVDYAGIAALLDSMGNCVITDISSHPITRANVLLPTLDRSYLIFNRSVFIHFAFARVVKVFAINGTYTAGDQLAINVLFTQNVMVFTPPVLKLSTGSTNRTAYYINGNNTNTLVFQYNVDLGDKSKRLDYVNTKLSPYNSLTPDVSMALNIDMPNAIRQGMTDTSLLFEYASSTGGGIFLSSKTLKIPAFTNLPLPGKYGSLSDTSNIIIDTSPPFIQKVTVTISNGTYSKNVVIPIVVIFSVPVVVGGCPKLLFRINEADKFATYIAVSDKVIEFDYFDKFSFVQNPCNSSQSENLDSNPSVFIMRKAIVPLIFANLTMPWVKYVESVIAPVSIVGSGVNISLVGSSAYPRLIWTQQNNSKIYSVGDIVNILLGFSESVSFPDKAYIDIIDINDIHKNIYFVKQINATTVLFVYTVQPQDLLKRISYTNEYSLYTTSSCSIIDLKANFCASQNLPIPFSVTPSSLDSFSTKNITIDSFSYTIITSVKFIFLDNSKQYATGNKVRFQLSFSDDVIFFGTPSASLFLGNETFIISFDHLASSYEAIFTADINSTTFEGSLKCTRDSVLSLNDGKILRKGNALSTIPVNISLVNVCCPLCSTASTNVISTIPYITRVYSNQSGVFTKTEEVDIYVETSYPVTVIGSVKLSLDLPNLPSAIYMGMFDLKTMRFKYTISPLDFTASLDYYSVSSLTTSVGKYDGVYLNSEVGSIDCELLLPRPGESGSLGRETTITINNDRPNLISSFATPQKSTSGDTLLIVLRYSESVSVVDRSGNLLIVGDNSQGSLGLLIAIYPADNSAVQFRAASLSQSIGTDVIFVYDVTSSDPTGMIRLSSTTPLISNNSIIKSVLSNTEGPTKFLDSVVTVTLATIDNNVPYVVNVFSPNISTIYPFGVGDVIDIYVQMSLGVIIVETPKLYLNLNNRVNAFAEYALSNSTGSQLFSSVSLLHFKYRVLSGDRANPLEYSSSTSLVGYLLRYSSKNPSIVADLTLPTPFSLGSLAYCCNIQIDSSKPYILYLVPLKQVGIYGENETILVLARFNKPVYVIGSPQLKLFTGKSVGYANYKKIVTEYDIPTDIRETDVIFNYIVQRYDNVLSLHHSDSTAIYLHNNSKILHKTNNPILPADITLRDPSDNFVINGVVNRQWKFRYPSSVEILLRDLYHSKPNSLTVSVEHTGYSSILFSGCCNRKEFGSMYPNSRSGTNATIQNIDTGIGSDFLFSDTLAVNIALKGSVTQSSTRVSGLLAIDNNVDPLIGDNSVSETNEEQDPWWSIQLPVNSTISSINIWTRKPQSWIDPVVQFTIRGYDKYPSGFFKLRFSNIDAYNTNVVNSTGPIPLGVDARSLEVLIETISGIGNVDVERRTLPLCAADFTGCGQGFERGLGHVYTLTFQSLKVSSPVVEITSIEFIGEQQIPPEIAIYNISSGPNIRVIQLFSLVQQIRKGQYIQVPAIVEYAKGIFVNTTSTAQVGSNQWLTPFWVFLFNSSTSVFPKDINSSIVNCVWFRRYESIDTVLAIVLDEPVDTKFVKIQKEGYGSLSLAEVQIFEDRLNTLSAYNRGSPVHPSILTNPYQPQEPLGINFANCLFDGRWLIQVTQDSLIQTDLKKGWSGAFGTISEVVLIITDLAGIVHSYYQDLRAEVTSLPKYGSLTSTTAHTASPYEDWRENFEVGASGELIPIITLKRNLGYCYGSCSGFAKGQLLDNRVLGDVPVTQFLRGERVVIYHPVSGYIGPDYFTYIIYDGLNVQYHAGQDNSVSSQNEVTIHVRICRRFQAIEYAISQSAYTLTTHPLCSCAQTEYSLINNKTLCNSIRTEICNNSEEKDKFLTMCQTCFDPSRGLSSGDCQAQTIRAVSLVESRGLCDINNPPMNCDNEYVTLPGREKVNYLSLKPPTLYGSMSKLRNSFGGYGWYGTSKYN